MASIKEMTTKSGKRFFQISVSRGYGKSAYKMRWYWPENWSRKTAEREVGKQAAEFERACAAGEILTRAEAKAKAAAEAAERAKLKSLRDYSNGVFMPAKETALSENARSSYQMFLDKHILPKLGDTLITEITPAMITKLLLDFQKAGYAHSTAIKLYNILNGIFEMAFLDDSIPVNPMLKVKRPASRKDEQARDESAEALTVKELAYVLSCASQEPLKWQAYINLAADTGCRRGELCGLYWSDIDWKKSTITIQRNLQYTAQKGIFETTPKNGKSRVVDIGQETLTLLRQLREEQASICISKYVFTQDNSPSPMHPQSPTRYFKKFGEKHNIPNFHPHLLRHTSASLAITNGGDVVSVSERLGHSDPATTLRRYSHANEESIRKAGQTVRNALKAENA